MVMLKLKEYIKAEDVNAFGGFVTISSEPDYIEQEFQGKKREVLVCNVKTDEGDEFIWSPNMTSQKALRDSFGKDTKEWLDKRIMLKAVEQMVSGKMKLVIYVDNDSLKEEKVE